MKDILTALIKFLKADTPVAAVVSTRIYRTNVPQDHTFPLIVVSRVDKVRGSKSTTGKIATARIQCTTSATTDGPAENLAELIGNALENKKIAGTILPYNLPSGAADGVYIEGIVESGSTPMVSNTIPPIYSEVRHFIVKFGYK